MLTGSEDNTTYTEGSKALVKGAGSRDKQYLELAGWKHHLLLDIGREKVSYTRFGLLIGIGSFR